MIGSDQRHSPLRRDLNDLVRGEDGKISGSKIGTYVGQYISGYLLFTNPLPAWDEMAILFTVLIAPEMWKMVMRMKYQPLQPDTAVSTTTTVMEPVANPATTKVTSTVVNTTPMGKEASHE